ncbi:MAG: PilZ domain-containing protein [Candidatus Omnitrophica bacterium]|nr:PilZ domain-containing protein [Candidatus Omnitrophota bacterium]
MGWLNNLKRRWQTSVGQRLDLGDQLSEERRRATRVSLSVPVLYRVQGNGRDWKQAKKANFSQSGVRLSVTPPISVGARIDLEMKLPNIPKPFQTEGTVVWVAPFVGHRSTVQCGVVFEDLRRVSNKERLTAFIADKLCQFALHSISDLTARPAQSLGEMKAAYRLVYKEYLARGYCQPNPSQMHYNFYCFLPETCTFILERKGQLLGTISLMGGSACGLPMETLFPEQIAELRNPGRRLAEVGLLALDLEAIGKSARLFSLTNFQKQASLFRLFKVMFDYARFIVGATDLVIGMHPKHEVLYRYLTFEAIGPVRSYPGACGKPALPMRMDIRRTEETTLMDHGKGFYFLRESMPKEILEKRFHWTEETVRQFLKEKRPLWDQLSPVCRAHLETCYPGLTA